MTKTNLTNLKIKKTQAGIRLDKFLAEKFPKYSRQAVKKNILEGNILVNKEKIKPKYILKEGDKISIEISLPGKIILKPNSSIKLNIVYEDKDVVVIDKPAGTVVHPAENFQTSYKTLVNALLAYFPEIKNVGEDKFRPGIVHRLDKETSGLLIVAKNNRTFNYLKEQFQKRKIEKHYLALVAGKLKEEKGVIEKPISRSKKTPTKQMVVEKKFTAKKIKEARTEYSIVKRFKNYTLVKAIPKTGRMHQIRIHFASLGHPIAGDKKYSFKRQKNLLKLDRHFLHAACLKFKLPCGRIIELESKLPKELGNALKALEKEKDL
jgi:23S rRNA pseudouridine1911/1915/1917 synthase